MGIHYDYKSTKGNKLMEKQAKREKKLAERNIFEAFDMVVTRLIRVSFGPYKLKNLNKSEIEKISYIDREK